MMHAIPKKVLHSQPWTFDCKSARLKVQKG